MDFIYSVSFIAPFCDGDDLRPALGDCVSWATVCFIGGSWDAAGVPRFSSAGEFLDLAVAVAAGGRVLVGRKSAEFSAVRAENGGLS